MQCAAHADRPATHTIDGQGACDACVSATKARRYALGSSLLVLVSVAYLLTLAIAYTLFKARPIVGGLAAVVALMFGRAVQIHLQRTVIQRTSEEP